MINRHRVQNSSQHFGHSCRQFFTQEIEQSDTPSLDWQNQRSISESNAAMKHLVIHTYQK